MLNKLNIKKITLGLVITMLACFSIATLLFFQIEVKDYKDGKYIYDINKEESFSAKDIKNIIIESSSSDINIIEYDDPEVKVHIYGKLYTKDNNQKNNQFIKFSDGSLDIRENPKKKYLVFNFGELINGNKIKIDLYLPKDYKENIVIDTSSGSIKADNLNLKKLDINTYSGEIALKDVKSDDISLETSSGKISADDIEADDLDIKTYSGNNDCKSITAEKVYFETSSGIISLGTVETKKITGDTYSGDIFAEKLTSDDVNLETSSGKITFGDVLVKKIKCVTYSGNVTFDNAALNDTYIETSSGNVILSLFEDSEFNLKAENSSGDITCDFPLVNTGEGKHQLKGVVGKGSNTIKIETYSGDIEINKK